MHTLVVDLPDEIYSYLQTIAGATRQPLELLVRQSITGNLPPNIPNAPGDMQAELLQMQGLPVAQLQQIAASQVATRPAQRHQELLEKNSEDTLTPTERNELAALRRQADQLMLRKAYAWALLRWRGHPLPAFEELPVQ